MSDIRPNNRQAVELCLGLVEWLTVSEIRAKLWNERGLLLTEKTIHRHLLNSTATENRLASNPFQYVKQIWEWRLRSQRVVPLANPHPYPESERLDKK